jgi:hypothetical protein
MSTFELFDEDGYLNPLAEEIVSEIKGLFGYVEPISDYGEPLGELLHDCRRSLVSKALDVWINPGQRKRGLNQPVSTFCREARAMIPGIAADNEEADGDDE